MRCIDSSRRGQGSIPSLVCALVCAGKRVACQDAGRHRQDHCDARTDDARPEQALREAIAKITTPATRISSLRVEAKAALAEVLTRIGETADARRLLQVADAENDAAHGTLPLDVQQLLKRANSASENAAHTSA
jgi:hypothetical protein